MRRSKRIWTWAAVLIFVAASGYEGARYWQARLADDAAWRRARELEAQLALRRSVLAASRQSEGDLSRALVEAASDVDERKNLASILTLDPRSRSRFRNPRLRDLRLKELREQQDGFWSPLLHKLQLSPQQEDRFRQILLGREQGLMDLQALVEAGVITPDERNNLMGNVGRDMDSNMKALLTADQDEDWLKYQHTKFVSDWVENLAVDSYGTATPLTGDQADQLVSILADPANHAPTPGYRAAAFIKTYDANWDQILPQATAILTPAQLADFDLTRQESVASSELFNLTNGVAQRFGLGTKTPPE